MNLTVDIGNTRIKWTLFDGDNIVASGEGNPPAHDGRVIVCATGNAPATFTGQWANVLNLSELIAAGVPLPIQIGYATPRTLGADRVAAACGAWKMSGGRPCVVIDAGTCITVDYIDRTGTYRGGAILPGIAIKFRALHTFTAKLPLLENEEPQWGIVTGCTTRESIMAGVLTATGFEIAGFVGHYQSLDSQVSVLLTGGDAKLIATALPTVLESCKVEPNLVAVGLNEVLRMMDN